ncbi:unnamed protein product [Ceratitis capitata]|uniref:(Mediterranean fruit fly) hypothetical protein n=1 Tax=Ceratitis capitata TaxID=7213 RepID=A0A811V2V2_CERCA|nr:unnamed protein product [Ceratitis capitata]
MSAESTRPGSAESRTVSYCVLRYWCAMIKRPRNMGCAFRGNYFFQVKYVQASVLAGKRTTSFPFTAALDLKLIRSLAGISYRQLPKMCVERVQSVCAPTGSGKTTYFCLKVILRNFVTALAPAESVPKQW